MSFRSYIYAALLVSFVISPADLFAQKCLHKEGESFEQRERRQTAIRYLEQLNAVQTRSMQETGKYLSLNELKVESGPLGFVPRLTVDQWNYVISLKDFFDPCGLTLFADQQGTIYEAYPTTVDQTNATDTSSAGRSAQVAGPQ